MSWMTPRRGRVALPVPARPARRVARTAYGCRMPLPPVGDLLASLHVVAIPMRVPFRGVTTREVALLEGPAGWGEFGPFVEYEPAEASRWLAAAVEAAWMGWPDPLRQSVPVNATVPAVGPERVAAVREVMGPSARVRVDANGGWSVDDALTALAALGRLGLEYAEQPCATVEELRDLRISLARNGIDVSIAADESIRKAE